MATCPPRSGLDRAPRSRCGLLNAPVALDGKHVSKEELARQAIHIEQNVIKEAVGSRTDFGGVRWCSIASNSGGTTRLMFLPIIPARDKQDLLCGT